MLFGSVPKEEEEAGEAGAGWLQIFCGEGAVCAGGLGAVPQMLFGSTEFSSDIGSYLFRYAAHSGRRSVVRLIYNRLFRFRSERPIGV